MRCRGRPETSTDPLPLYASYGPNVFDARLNSTQLPVDSQLLAGSLDEDQYAFINPSFETLPSGDVAVAVRRHFVRTELKGVRRRIVYDGQDVIALGTQTTYWYSYIATGRMDGATLGLVAPLQKIDLDWSPCTLAPVYVPANNTVSELITTGPEDPRLFRNPGTAAQHVSFLSLPHSETGDARPADDGLGRVFTAPTAATSAFEVSALEINSGNVEQNWLAMPNEDDLYFIQNLHPFILLKQGPTGLSKAHIAIHPVLRATADAGFTIHGGANPVPYTDSTLLAAFHTVRRGAYANYLVELLSEPPFMPVRVSRRLPLLEATPRDVSVSRGMTFVSGLAVLPDGRVLVGYGSSNVEARVLQLTLEALALLF